MIIDRSEYPYDKMPPPKCGGCGGAITSRKHILWLLQGTDDLNLHARCAARLSLHLASDALKLDLATGYYLGHPDPFHRDDA